MEAALAVDDQYELDIILRPRVGGDTECIYSSWIRSYCADISIPGPQRSWLFAAQRSLIHDLLPRCHTLVACQPEHPDQVYGYLVHGPGRVMHWIYVKDIFRRAGVATRLMVEAFGDFKDRIYYTHGSRCTPHYRRRWNLYSNTRELELIIGRQD